MSDNASATTFQVGDRVRVSSIDIDGLCWDGGPNCGCTAHHAKQYEGRTGQVEYIRGHHDTATTMVFISGVPCGFYVDELEAVQS